MRITSKGQVTIPQAFREKAGLLPQSEVEFELKGRTVLIRLSKNPKRSTRGMRFVDSITGKGDVQMTTDEIMALTRGE